MCFTRSNHFVLVCDFCAARQWEVCRADLLYANVRIRTRRSDEATHARAHAQDRDKNLLSQLQKLKTEKKDIEEDVRQLVLIMEDRRAELTKQREAYEQVLTPA